MNAIKTETMPVLGRCKHKNCEYALFSDPQDIRAASTLSDVVPGAAFRMTDRGNLLACCPAGRRTCDKKERIEAKERS